jgi:predicted TIM-barrel fold metal-dependent hydrolase
MHSCRSIPRQAELGTVASTAPITADAGIDGGVVDCGVAHAWASDLDLIEYLPEGWREYVLAHVPRPWREFAWGEGERPKGRMATPIMPDLAYYNPLGDFALGSLPEGADSAGSDLGLLRAQHLDPASIRTALLCVGTTSGALVPGLGVVRLSIEATRAVNDFTIDRWLNAEERVLGTVLAATQDPAAAAAEIRRAGEHPRMAAVLLTVSGLARPFGHPAYTPILEAAYEMDLPIVIQAGSDQAMETATYPAAGGVPTTFSEFRVLASQSLMTHAASLISQGVPMRYPSLRFLLLGGSPGWITPFFWRFDSDFRSFHHDVRFLDEMPSTVFRRHFFVSTFPMRFEAAGDRFAKYLAVDHELGDVICYASGYPDQEYDPPSAVAAMIPPEWHSRVFNDNPRRFLGARAATHAGAAASEADRVP